MAANELGYTQSAVSHAVAALERELDLKLLKRSRSGVYLTRDGERLLPFIKQTVEARQNLMREVQSIHGAGCVRIGAFTSVAVHWLPGMIKTYGTDHPSVEIRMLNGDYYDIEQWLFSDSIDIGFVTDKINISNCTYIPLFEDKLLVAMPKNHPLSIQKTVRAEELEGQSFISLLQESDQDARSVLLPSGVKVDVRYKTKDDYAIIAMVEQGLGISIMPQLLLEGHSEGIHTAQIEGGKKRTIGLAVSPSGMKNPCVKSFVEYASRFVSDRYEKRT